MGGKGESIDMVQKSKLYSQRGGVGGVFFVWGFGGVFFVGGGWLGSGGRGEVVKGSEN